MNRKLPQAFPGAIALAALLGIGALSSAEAADNVRVRGTVGPMADPYGRDCEGPNAMLMKPGWKMAGAKASVEDIAGDFVGIASPLRRQAETARLFRLSARDEGTGEAISGT
jgi:hypothetical protein